MKKLVLLLSLVLLFGGCKTTEVDTQTNVDQQTTFSSSFNEDHYVWENFIFTTNRVEKVN